MPRRGLEVRQSAGYALHGPGTSRDRISMLPRKRALKYTRGAVAVHTRDSEPETLAIGCLQRSYTIGPPSPAEDQNKIYPLRRR